MEKSDTARVKGIAIMLMLFHHLFGTAERYSTYGFTGLIVNQNVTMTVASDCKLCVAIFALLTGYGMMAKYNRESDENIKGKVFCKSTVKSYFSLIKDTAFLMPIMVVMAVVLGFSKTPESVWGGTLYTRIWGIITNMFGIAGYLNMDWFVLSWWYLKVAVLFIFMFPVFCIVIKRCGSICLALAFVYVLPYMFKIDMVDMTDTVVVWRYYPAFIFGMILAEEDIPEKIRVYGSTLRKRIICSVFLSIILIIFIHLKHKYGLMYITESVQAGVISMITFMFLGRIPALSQGLNILGINSKYIWLIHVFIYGQVMKDWLFSLHNIWLIFTVLMVVSLVASIILKIIADRFYDFMGRAFEICFGELKTRNGSI